VSVLHSVASQCIPAVPKNFFKYWWDQELQTLKEQSIAAHKEWVSHGRPRQGQYFENNKSAKYKYKSRIKQHKSLDNKSISNSLHDALLRKDQSSFWNVWKSKFSSKNRNVPHSIDGATDHGNIANLFAKSFESCCSNTCTYKAYSFKQECIEQISNYAGDSFNSNCLFTVECIDKIISELKRGKAASLDGLTAEHVINSHPVIVSILVKLFNLLLISSYVPNAFGIGLCIPLLKNNNTKSQSSVDGYRGITISPILSKVFELGIGEKLDSYLRTSDLQFGFKKKLSCGHAIFSVRSTIDYFVKRGSTVNICAMDLSKAFDKINHYCCFLRLLERRIPLCFILLLECWYSKTFVYVRWCDSLSVKVKQNAGVRQGGILSPALFAVYVHGCYFKEVRR